MKEVLANALSSSKDAFVSQSLFVTGGMIGVLKTATAQNYSCMSAFIILALDYFDSLPQEISYIWSSGTSPGKLAFLYARYFGLLTQLGTCIMALVRLTRYPAPQTFCRGWYGLQIFGYWSMFASGDLILMLRVYDLYERSREIAMLLVILFSIEMGTTAISVVESFRVLEFDPVCNGIAIPSAVIVFASVLTITQCIVWSLTFRKGDSWITKKNILNILASDATWFWVAISAMLLITLPTSYAYQIAVPHITFSWPTTIHSVGTCRLLINQEMRRYKLFEEFLKQDVQPVPGHPRVHRDSSGILTPSTRVSSAGAKSKIETEKEDVESQLSFTIPDGSISTSYTHTLSGTSTNSSHGSRLARVKSRQSSYTISDQSTHSILEDDLSQIEIGSSHACSVISSEEERRFWNDI